ncbi:MAG: DUF4974 domain-containing protein [Prevotella sp.]|nr:DUF4974 domain-containing protein [Prevotella sp.]
MKKDSNEQMERLLDMVEHPDRYTDEQLDELLQDDEIRQTYQLMADAASAYEYGRTDGNPSAETVEEEWQKVLTHGAQAHPARHNRRQIVAAVIGIVMVSGIALATVGIVRSGWRPSAAHNDMTANHAQTQRTASQKDETADTAATFPLSKEQEELPGKALPPRQFDDVTLQDIVQEMADYYRVKTVSHNPEVGQLRLRYLWHRDESVERAVETLNMFEKVQLTYADSTITIE